MIKFNFPSEVIIGLSSIIPIVKFLTGNKHKKIAIVYKKKFFPWKMFCLWFSLSFRLKRAKMINFSKQKQIDQFNNKKYDAIVCMGDKRFIDEIKVTRYTPHLVTIEETSGTLYGLSSIVYDPVNQCLIKNNKFIPEIAYDNYRRKLKMSVDTYVHLFANLSIAISTYLLNENEVLNALSFKPIRTLNSLINFYKLDKYKKMNFSRRRKIRLVLSQLDQITFTIVNNCDDNELIEKNIKKCLNYEIFEKELAKNFKTEFDKLIAEMKKRKQESSKWRFNKCDVYDWDKLEKTVKDFYANIHI